MSTVRYPMDSHAVLRAYDRWAHVYDMSFALFIRPYHKRVINEVNQGRGAVLDVGVGTGAMLPYYKDHLEITGIDLSPAMLERAHRRVEKHALDHVKELLVMDATKMDFPDAHFESVCRRLCDDGRARSQTSAGRACACVQAGRRSVYFESFWPR